MMVKSLFLSSLAFLGFLFSLHAQEDTVAVKKYQAKAPPTQPFGPEAFQDSHETTLRWLGMAGFFINSRGTTLMVDHLHPDGQIVLATRGVGYYQEKGSPKRILRKGDVVTCPPNVPHWHGAIPDSTFVQIAITSRKDGPTEWMQAVSEKEYLRGRRAGENNRVAAPFN